MEVIQLPVGPCTSTSNKIITSSNGRAQGHARRRSHISLLASSSSSTTLTPSLISLHHPSPSSPSTAACFRYSVSSNSSSSSVVSASTPFFLNDEEVVEQLSRSNTSSPTGIPSTPRSYHSSTTTIAAAAVCNCSTAISVQARRHSQYRPSASSRLLPCCNRTKSSAVVSASLSCHTSSGYSAPIKQASCTTTTTAAATKTITRPSRSSTLPSYTFKPASLAASLAKRCSLISSSLRTDTGSRLSWYDPLSSERFQRKYVDDLAEEDSDSSDASSDTEEPTGCNKPALQAIQESILYFNSIAEIPVPAFFEKAPRIPNSRSSSTPADPNVKTSNTITGHAPTSSSHSHSAATICSKRPSLVPLDTSSSFAPILEKDCDSLDDSDSLNELSLPTDSAGTSVTSASSFPSKEAAEAWAREQIDLEVEAAIKENTRIEEERRAREAEEDAEFLRALHESILAEKEAQARREDLEFLDRLFSNSRPVSPAYSSCSSASSRSSVYSFGRRNSTILTALSPAPSRSPIKLDLPPTTSSTMPSTATEFSTPVSHNSRERPISAVRERKSKDKPSSGEPYEMSTDGPALRPTLHRSHTSSSGGFRRLLGLSGRNIHTDDHDDERYHAKSPRSSKKTEERSPMDRRSSDTSTRSNHRHRHHHQSEERERDGSHHRSHHRHHRHSESGSSTPNREKRRSREKTKTPEDSPTKRSREKDIHQVIPIIVRPPEIVEPVSGSATPRGAKVVDESRRRKKKTATLGDILRASRKVKEAIPVEPPKMVECITCLSDDIPETEAAKLDCGHSFCNECLVRLFDLSLTDPAHMPPRCCQPTQHIPLNHVDKLLSRKTKILWNKKYQEYTTVNRRYCPATDCGEWIRPKDFKNVEGVEIGTCPRCKLKICALCGLKEHGSEECPKDEFFNQVQELGKELGWQRCYSCRAMVELERGCNHMTCRCTAEFCMICGAKWKTCECPWFNFPPEEGDAPPPHLDANGRLIDDMDLAWGNDPRTEDDERAARQLAEDFAELDMDGPRARNMWAPLLTGPIGEGVLRLLSRTRHLEGAALDRLRNAYASTFDDDFGFGGSDNDDDTGFWGGNRRPELPPRPRLRQANSDDHERRQRNRNSTYNLDWSPRQSREDIDGDDDGDYSFFPQITRAFLPRMFGGHHHHNHHNEPSDNEEFVLRRSVSDLVHGGNPDHHHDMMGHYGDLLEGDLFRMRRDFDNVRWGGIGAA